jgi:hypothetical protein
MKPLNMIAKKNAELLIINISGGAYSYHWTFKELNVKTRTR